MSRLRVEAIVQGRVTDRVIREIPGAYHIAAGTPIHYCKQEWRSSDQAADPDYPSEHLESVFVGTHAGTARWDEIGTRHLTLHLAGPPGTVVELRRTVMGDPHPAAVRGLPPQVKLLSDRAVIPFLLTIDPVDPAFHVVFRLLLDAGIAEVSQYDAAAADLSAMLRRAAAHRERLLLRPRLPAKRKVR